MTNKKLTDNEIIKALEVCSKYTGFKDCEKCPLKPNCDANVLETLALDLINRLQAENERLKIECGLAKFDRYKAEFEEFRAEIKAKAYKEMADKLTRVFIDLFRLNTWQREELKDVVDRILKEMVGEDNEG